MNRAQRRQKDKKKLTSMDLEVAKKEAISTSVNLTLSITLFILKREFKLSKKDMNKFLTEYTKGFKYINEGYIAPTEFIDSVLEETGIDVRKL